jgi:hypothetical protein
MTATKQQVAPDVVNAPGTSNLESHLSLFECSSAWLRADFNKEIIEARC